MPWFIFPRRKPTTVSDVSQLSGLSGSFDGKQVLLSGWHPNTRKGGGLLIWTANAPKSGHNGGTIFSPTVPWTTNVAGYLNGVGETDPSGFGCWVREDDKVYDVLIFGAVGDGLEDDSAAISATLNHGATYVPEGRFLISATLDHDNVKIFGVGTLVKANAGQSHMLRLGGSVKIDGITLESFGAPRNAEGLLYLKEGAEGIYISNTNFLEVGNTYCAITASNPTAGPLYETNIRDLYIEKCHFSGFARPLYLASIEYFTIYKCIIERCRFDAIRTRRNMMYIRVDGNTFRQIGDPSATEAQEQTQTRDCLDAYWSGRDLQFINNFCTDVSVHVLDIKGMVAEAEINEDTGIDAKCARIQFTGNTCKRIGYSALYNPQQGDALYIQGNKIISAGHEEDYPAFRVSSPSSVIVDNWIIDCPMGIYFHDVRECKSVVRGNHFINSSIVDIRWTSEMSACLVENNIFLGLEESYTSSTTHVARAIQVDSNANAGKFLSVCGNFIDKELTEIAREEVIGAVSNWRNNIVTRRSVSPSDLRFLTDGAIFASDWGHISTRSEAQVDNYKLGDAVVRFGTNGNNRLMIVGASEPDSTPGTGSGARHSNSISTDSGFDFSEISEGRILTISGVLGVYQVVTVNEETATIALNKHLERNFNSSTISLHHKRFYSVDLN